MMKYLWKYKSAITVVLIVGLGQLGFVSKPLWAISSGVKDSLQYFPSVVTSDRAQVYAENQLLFKELSRLYAEVALLKYASIQESQATTIVNTSANNLDEVIKNLETDTSVAGREFDLVATPLFKKSSDSLYRGEFSNSTEALVSQGDLVVAGNYLVGEVVSSSASEVVWRPFKDNSKPISAITPAGDQLPVSVENIFTYQVEFPNEADVPNGLIEAETSLVLGLLISQSQSEDTINALYQLPWQPRVGDRLSIIPKPLKLDAAKEETI